MGRVFKYGDNVNTDLIISAKYLNTVDPKELAEHCFEDLDSSFRKNVEVGDILVAGENFGCGSSREHAPIAIKYSGIFCAIAKSFARIFYRNAINIGLPILECEEAVKGIGAGDEVEVDLASGEIKNITKKKVFKAKPTPEFVREIYNLGGLMNFVKMRLKNA